MNKREITLIAFADFSRAFDTVDLAIIIKKLHTIGFSHSSLKKQLVQVNDRQSNPADVLFGVPQRSILGRVPCFYFFLFRFVTRTGTPQPHEPITVGPYHLTHPVYFPCGRKPECQEETHDFRQSVEFYSFHMRT